MLGVAAGQATITAGSQSVTNTATLNVTLTGVTNFEVCEGTFGATTTCSSGSTPLTWSKCVNAVSEWFEAEVRRAGKVYQMRFAQGKTTQKMAIVGDTKKTGTK